MADIGSEQDTFTARPRLQQRTQPTTYQPQPAQVQTSQTPTQQGSASSSPWPNQQQSYTPPANAGSWNSYYQQPGTTQAPQDPWGPGSAWQQLQSGSWGGQQFGTQPMQSAQQSQAPGVPYQMGADFRYNTGGAANTQLGQYGNRLEGFESSKLNDPTRTTAKYMFGRIASKYEPTQQGFQQLMQDPEFQRLGMQSLGGGKIRLPNGDVIDVVRGFQSGGQAWQWGAETVNGQPTDFGAPAQAPAQGQGLDPWAQYAQQQQAWQQQQAQQWQDYYNQMAQWQAYQQQFSQAQPQPGYDWIGQEAQLAQQPPAQTGYYEPPQQLPASPYYGGTGGYNTGVGLQSGGAGSPYEQTFNYLAQGMPSPYYYG